MKNTKLKGIYENQNSDDVMGLAEINIHEIGEMEMKRFLSRALLLAHE